MQFKNILVPHDGESTSDNIKISSQIKMDRGDSAEKILEYVNENKVDLIVMGTERRKGISK